MPAGAHSANESQCAHQRILKPILRPAFLLDTTPRCKFDVHAYISITNYIHILLTHEYKESISLTMQSVGGLYVHNISQACSRTDVLRESRHKAGLIEPQSYLLACCRYIEMNPVAAYMVQLLADSIRSSDPANVPGEPGPVIKTHKFYNHLGATYTLRRQA